MANYSIPTWELAKSNKQLFRKKAFANLMKRANLLGITSFIFRENELYEEPLDMSIRELRASDLGLRKWQTPTLVANENVSWINYRIPPARVIVIYAVSLLSKNPHVSSLSAGYLGYRFDIVEVEKLQVILPLLRKLRDYSTKQEFLMVYDLSEIVMEAYLSDMWIIDCDRYLQIDAFSPVSAPGDRILLRGFIGERKGETIA